MKSGRCDHRAAPAQQESRMSAAQPPTSEPSPPTLRDFDPSLELDDNRYEELLRSWQLRLLRLQVELRDERPFPVVVVFEGVDAGGKGGAIRRLTGHLDPRGYRVYPIGAPTEAEARHHYLWRFYTSMPERGQIAIFDRSWYGRVLVERVEGLAAEPEWQRAYDDIVDFEETHVRGGLVLVKFWLQITKDEQLERFQAREEDPFKEYKITEDDWRNRERWDEYQAAAEDMLQRTHRPWAPWTLVSGEDKRHARIHVLETVVTRLEQAMGWADAAQAV
ncbi:MAG: hypothetical protein GEU80_13530 [Dehalococcoidia bacterium]|nr:hypothetical protein [Dehalococcoidia bacterium]